MARAQKRANAGRASRGLIAAVAMFSVAAACAVTGAEATFHVSSELGADLPASIGTRAGSTARVATTGAHDDVPAVPHGDDCAMMKLVVDFAQHRGRQATHARFDVRAIHHDAVPAGVQDHLGTLIGSSSAEGPVTIVERMCLPRDQGYVLIASGNATRGSSFDRFNVTVINEEYLDLVAFRAGSDWTRGSSFRSDRLAASGAGASSAQLGGSNDDPHAEDYEVEFFEDEGVGAPLFDSPDGGKTYRLHGRARFDVWPEAPIDGNGVWTECGVLAAVSVGATSYGNGAAPRDMSWALWDKADVDAATGTPAGDPLVAAGGDSFTWGSTMTAVACLRPGTYEFIAEDGGDLNRGWGFGTTVEVTEIVLDKNTRAMRQRKIADVDGPSWFTGGRRKSLTFHVDEADAVVEAAARALQPKTAPPTPEIVEIETHDTVLQDDGTGRDEEESFVVEPTVIDAMDETRSAGARLAQPQAGGSSEPAPVTDWSKYSSESGHKGITGGMAWASLGRPSNGAVSGDAKNTRRTLLAAELDGGKASKQSALGTFRTAAAATMALAAAAAGAAHLAHAAKRQRELRFGAAAVTAAVVDPEKQALLPQRLKLSARTRDQRTSPATAPLLAVAAMAGLVAFAGPFAASSTASSLGDAFSEAAGILAAREAAARLGEPGEPLCGAGIDRCRLLAPTDCRGRVFAYHPGVLAHIQGGAQTADVLSPMGAVLADGSGNGQGLSLVDQNARACERRVDISRDRPDARGSTCVRAVGRFESSVTLEGCVKSCRETPGCEWYHAYRLASSPEDGQFDECRLCAGGGEGVWAGPKDGADVVSVSGPAWCLTPHNLTSHATGAKRSVQQCRAACDATKGCDAFNFGDERGDCTLLRVGNGAKRGPVWRGSGFSPLGVTGYATYYAVSHAEVDAARGGAGSAGALGAVDPEDWTAPAPAESRRLAAHAADSRCVASGGQERVKPYENLAKGKPTTPLAAAAVVDGVVGGDEEGADLSGACPAVVKGLGAAGKADESVEIDLQGSFTLGALSVFAAPGDAAALAGVDRSALLGSAKVPASALVTAVNADDGVERTCGEIVPGAGEKTAHTNGAVELFNVRGCAGFVATHVRVESARAGAVTHLCEVLAHAAHQPAMTKFPALPKWLELREETRAAMEEAAAEFVQGRADADDALIVNRDGDVDGKNDAQTHEPFITGEDAKAKIESLERDGDDDDWRVRAHASSAAAHIPDHDEHEARAQEEADALKLTEEAIEREEKERLHSYERDVDADRHSSDSIREKRFEKRFERPTNSAYRADDIDAVPDDAMDLISQHFAVPKTVESSYDVDEAAARRERRAMAPGPAPSHVPFSDVAVPDEDRAGHHEPGSHARVPHKGGAQGPAASAQGPAPSPASAAHHHWPPVPTGTFSHTPAVVEPEADVEHVPEASSVEHKSTQVVSPEVTEDSCERVCEGHGFNKEQCDAIPGCEFGEDANCWSAVGPNPCPSQAEWELYVSKHPKSVPKDDFIEVVTSLDNCEKVCGGHGFDRAQCLAIPGCTFAVEGAYCYSAVGPNPCPSLLEWNFWHKHANDHVFHDDHGHGEYKEEYNQQFIAAHPEYADHAAHDEHTDFHPYEIIDQMVHAHPEDAHEDAHPEEEHMAIEPNPELHEDADGEVHMYHVDESLDEHYVDDLEHANEREHDEPYRPDPIHTHAEVLENEDNHVVHEEVMHKPIETEATATMKAEVTTAAIPEHKSAEEEEAEILHEHEHEDHEHEDHEHEDHEHEDHEHEEGHHIGPVEITETHQHGDNSTFETTVVTEPVVDSEVPLPNPTTEHDPVPDIVEVHGSGNATNAPVAVPDDEAAPFPELHDDPAYNPRPAPAFPPGQSATLHDLQFVTCPGQAQCDKPPCVPYVHDLLEAHLVEGATSCCQASDEWEYGNPRRFPHVCGQCSRNEHENYLTYAEAAAFCASKGGGLCRNNQVTVAGRADHCALDPDSVVWTDKLCDRGKGRQAVKLNGDYSHCVSDLAEKLPVVCCANTCEGFTPKRMCPHVAAR